MARYELLIDGRSLLGPERHARTFPMLDPLEAYFRLLTLWNARQHRLGSGRFDEARPGQRPAGGPDHPCASPSFFFLILEDWAHGVSFDEVEIDKERGVVLEEWRLGQGAGSRIQRQRQRARRHQPEGQRGDGADGRHRDRQHVGKAQIRRVEPDPEGVPVDDFEARNPRVVTDERCDAQVAAALRAVLGRLGGRQVIGIGNDAPDALLMIVFTSGTTRAISGAPAGAPPANLSIALSKSRIAISPG